jgi:hypothetical protein
MYNWVWSVPGGGGLVVERKSTLGYFITEILYLRRMSNHALAVGAGISDSVVRNLTQHGIDPRAKDPDPHTLRTVANFLGINPVKLFKLAGYITSENAYSVRAEYLAYLFDLLPTDKQLALLNIAETLVEDVDQKKSLQLMREEPENPMAGIVYAEGYSPFFSIQANLLLTNNRFPGPAELTVDLESEVWPAQKFKDMPLERQERLKVLMRAKLNLDFDSTMIGTEGEGQRGQE